MTLDKLRVLCLKSRGGTVIGLPEFPRDEEDGSLDREEDPGTELLVYRRGLLLLETVPLPVDCRAPIL